MSQFYVPSLLYAAETSIQNFTHLSPISSGLMAFQKRKGSVPIVLTITGKHTINLGVFWCILLAF